MCETRQQRYRKNRKWADQFNEQVTAILRDNSMYIVQIEIAEDFDDRKYATDMHIKVHGGDVAVRLRRPKYFDSDYRDLTIRSRLSNGYRTELDKIKDGFCDWYLVGWIDHQYEIGEWILVDLDELRRHKLWEGKREIPNQPDRNGERSWFIPISAEELRQNGCIVTERMMQAAIPF